MSFRIHAWRQADEEVRRLAMARMAQAIEVLQDASPEGVHDARRRLKELRALLRLIRQPLGRKAFKVLNETFRDLGRYLSTDRDASALVECWDALAREHPRRFASPAMQQVRNRLVERAQAIGESSGRDAVCQAVQQCLEEGREAVKVWPLQGEGFELFAAGVVRVYVDGQKALKKVRKEPSAENLHAWRKRVKDHWYQTRLLQEAWPELFKARQKSLKALADWLGQDHDLAMLEALLSQEPELFGAPNTRKAIAESVVRRRQHLLAQSLPMGLRLYAEPADRLLEGWAQHWHITCDEHLSVGK